MATASLAHVSPSTSYLNPGHSSLELGLFQQRPLILFVATAFIFILAFAIRVHYLEASSLIAERQFRSALIARAYYYNSQESIPKWRKQIAHINAKREGLLEPPILEFFVSLIYRLVDGEHLWIPQLLSSLFWILGGVFLFKIVKRFFSTDVSFFATSYYLFVPIGIFSSISFLPDSLMIMMFLFSLLRIVQYYERPTTLRLTIAAAISGLAILVKPLCLFAILGAFTSHEFHKKSIWKCFVNFNLFIFMALSIFPSALYYLYGIFAEESIETQFRVSFLPHLFLYESYWKGWLLTAIDAVGYTPLIAALIGLSLLPKGFLRTLLIGLWTGYIIFGLMFTYHIRFATHYHLQLAIIVSFSFCTVISLIIDHITKSFNGWQRFVPVACVIALIVFSNIREVRQHLSHRKFESEVVAQEIGKIVDHSTKTVFLASYYGIPLKYYGEFSGEYWPRRISHWALRGSNDYEPSVQERIDSIGFVPEYFIVTDFGEFNKYHDDLKEFLEDNCTLIAVSDSYLIYGVCMKNDTF